MLSVIQHSEIQVAIIEDDVKNAMKEWLEDNGYISVESILGARSDLSVECIHPTTGKRLIVACTGESPNGDQLPRSWPNVASTILSTLIELENPETSNEVGVAFPDTYAYRNQMNNLHLFCKRLDIAVFWIARDGQVKQW